MKLTRGRVIGGAVAFAALLAGGSVGVWVGGGEPPPGAVAPATPAATGATMCGSSTLNSPYSYNGAATTFTSGQFAGLPTFGTTGSNFPASDLTNGVIVPTGNNLSFTFSTANTVYYFEPGTHTIQGTISTGLNSVYVGGYTSGAGEATITGVAGGTTDGSPLTSSPSGHPDAGQTFEYLTIENYGANQQGSVLGQESGAEFAGGITYEYDTIGPNEYGFDSSGATSGLASGGGYAIGATGGPGIPPTIIEHNCLTQNAQGAWNILNETGTLIEYNEVSYNAEGEYPDGGTASATYKNGSSLCDCAGGGKSFQVVNAVIDHNYVHDNYDVGIWTDFDNAGTDISFNYISSNWSLGIDVESSYNTNITDNTLVGNGWASDGLWPAATGSNICGEAGSGSATLCENGYSATAQSFGNADNAVAIYIPNSGGNSNLTSNYEGQFNIEGNDFINNFGNIGGYNDDGRVDGEYALYNDSECSIALGGNDIVSNPLYYYQNATLYTAADATISGTSVTSTGGTKNNCSPYGTNTNPSSGTFTNTTASGGVSSGTLNVASASSFPSAGTLIIAATGGTDVYTYTGTTSTSFTGMTLSSGSGTVSSGNAVTLGYGSQSGGRSSGSTAETPQVGMQVYNLSTGASYGTVASASSATSFTLASAPGNVSGVSLFMSMPGGCGIANLVGATFNGTSGNPSGEYYNNCMWTQMNVTVSGNTFNINASTVTGCTAAAFCGTTTEYAFAPGNGTLFDNITNNYSNFIANALSGGANNVWSNNTYIWSGSGGFLFFAGGQTATPLSPRSKWCSSPYSQDTGSTFNGGSC